MFVDDGYSGTSYDHPGFQKMLAEIKTGNVMEQLLKLSTDEAIKVWHKKLAKDKSRLEELAQQETA